MYWPVEGPVLPYEGNSGWTEVICKLREPVVTHLQSDQNVREENAAVQIVQTKLNASSSLSAFSTLGVVQYQGGIDTE